MFIHLGGSRTLRIREVIAILDADVLEESGENTFLEMARRKGKVERISPEAVKSYVITKNGVFASPISSTTLKKRADDCQIPGK
ncbi:MAG: extracellular matrix/biofilm biosynthesis regulator RemA family protein [Thermoactinomyces sp.]